MWRRVTSVQLHFDRCLKVCSIFKSNFGHFMQLCMRLRWNVVIVVCVCCKCHVRQANAGADADAGVARACVLRFHLISFAAIQICSCLSFFFLLFQAVFPSAGLPLMPLQLNYDTTGYKFTHTHTHAGVCRSWHCGNCKTCA